MMFTTMEQLMDYLLNRESALGMDFKLDRMERMLKALGNPEKQFRSIHIAGSNGKGSTLKVLQKILEKSGRRTGTFTSPHLEKVNERIMINDTMIADEELLGLMNEAAAVIEEYKATYFEILTLLSFMYFARKKVDLAVIETGLGGRLDSTNVITPLLSIITSISLEHTNILGDTLAKIAFEKAGIIKQGVPVLTGVREEEPFRVISAKAEEKQAGLSAIGREIHVSDYALLEEGQSFSLEWHGTVLKDLIQPMLGRHQADNAALGITAALVLNEIGGLHITEEQIRSGLRASVWPGRFETAAPGIIMDGAHNPAGVTVLIDTLKRRYPDQKYTFVFAVLEDKKFTEMLKQIERQADRLYLTSIENDRAASLEQLLQASTMENKEAFPSWEEAADRALAERQPDEILVFTGSLYFIACIRPYLRRVLGGN